MIQFYKAALVFLLPALLAAQTFVAEINLEAPRVNPGHQKDLPTLQTAIENYINTNSFGPEAYNYQVKFRIQIFVDHIDLSGSETMYHAQAVFTNDYDQRYVEGNWKFPFSSGENLYRSGIFHPLSGMIDFYGYLIMANELDGIELNSGSGLFDKANEVIDLALSSSRWSSGWSSRKQMLREISGNYQLRKARLRWNEALWAIEDADIPASKAALKDAMSNLKSIIDYKSKDKYTRVFIDSRYQDAKYFYQAYKDTFFLPDFRQLSLENNAYFDQIVK
ncbi:MAG TPA: DUF4835 family protein [Candidatus Marinimicrobia bacterium]|nr:DUF4835 family protein [Candidatus Neomarinimicrobiota bacterium]